ncbi:MAG TPA: hypothetical protein PK733_10605 [Clostridiales bacterium]|nr:hypothetical protein [Clostridiales bacterium]
MNIKALLLDFYGTLVYEDGEVISRVCEKIRKMSPYCPETREIATYWWEKFFSSGDNRADIECYNLLDLVGYV